MSVVPTLETARLVLRPPVDEDAAAIFAIRSDPETMRYWNAPPMVHLDEARTLIARDRALAEVDEGYRWMLVPKEGGAAIGVCGLVAVKLDHRRAELGYVLARTHWGRGLMGEALEAILAHAFLTLDLNRVEAELDPRNGASERILARLGFTREGLQPERWWVAGEVSDSLLMGLLRPAWQAARADGAARNGG